MPCVVCKKTGFDIDDPDMCQCQGRLWEGNVEHYWGALYALVSMKEDDHRFVPGEAPGEMVKSRTGFREPGMLMGELAGHLHAMPKTMEWCKGGKQWMTCDIPDEKKLYAVDFGIFPPEHDGLTPVQAWLDTAVRFAIFGEANHACRPNCELIDGRLGESRGVFVQNLRPIKVYDEITFDYGGYYRDGKFGQMCAVSPEECTCHPVEEEEETEDKDEEMEDVDDEDTSGEYTWNGGQQVRKHYFV